MTKLHQLFFDQRDKSSKRMVVNIVDNQLIPATLSCLLQFIFNLRVFIVYAGIQTIGSAVLQLMDKFPE